MQDSLTGLQRLELAGVAIVAVLVGYPTFLFGLWVGLPAHDEAKRSPFLFLLLDPFVLAVAMPVGVLTALCGFGIMQLLHGRNAGREARRIAVITIVSAAALASFLHVIALPAAMLMGAGLVASKRMRKA